MTDQTMFSAILGHSKSFIFVSSHPKSSWVTKTFYVGGPPAQNPIYCDSVVTTTILCILRIVRFLKNFTRNSFHFWYALVIVGSYNFQMQHQKEFELIMISSLVTKNNSLLQQFSQCAGPRLITSIENFQTRNVYIDKKKIEKGIFCRLTRASLIIESCEIE